MDRVINIFTLQINQELYNYIIKKDKEIIQGGKLCLFGQCYEKVEIENGGDLLLFPKCVEVDYE